MVPILLVVTVPARVVTAKTLEPSWITAVAITATVVGLFASRGVFQWSLRHYRSASS